MTSTQTLPDEIYGPEFNRDPYPIFARLREEAPVRRVTTYRGLNTWLVTRYADVRRLLADSRLAKDGSRIGELMARHSKVTGNATGFPAGLTTNMVNSDPPDHTRLRNLVGREFTGRRVEQLRPRIEQIVDEMLDEIAAQDQVEGEVDLAATLSLRLPIAVIGELLGVPHADRMDFFAWADTLYGGKAEPAELGRAYQDVVGYLRRLCEAKRDTPGEDLLTALVQVSADEDRLNPDELVSMALLLLMAGHETTSNQLSNSMLSLLTAPDQLARLREHPELVTGAVEELLRFEGPGLSASMRFTTEPVEVAGTVIPEGEFVMLSLASGNRDPEKFPDPDRLDITRPTNGALAMGHGIHHCVGAALGRLELEIAIGKLVRRFPHVRLAVEPDAVEWIVNSFFRGPVKLPLRLHG
ncbi:cytochrome P450 family protein [Streptomyces sp. 8L]|uniref:cytochrome P450 family protein n=1 Tax=Streptomyces sp. 8L TaxID=2877242 RepID=UPI001CD219EA|nr:cytochrome P450 [Streptomyces sp. 8L]MCA1217793.1 cytochrome P450 [Streptomyces sp. 8L]